MSRLTQRNDDSYVYEEYMMTRGGCCTGVTRSNNEAIDKLGRLEDVEDRLSCPIETVFKALTDGIYVKTVGRSNSNLCQTIITKIKSPALRMASDGSGRIRLERTAPTRLGPDSFELDRYGIDWALTKEELQ